MDKINNENNPTRKEKPPIAFIESDISKRAEAVYTRKDELAARMKELSKNYQELRGYLDIFLKSFRRVNKTFTEYLVSLTDLMAKFSTDEKERIEISTQKDNVRVNIEILFRDFEASMDIIEKKLDEITELGSKVRKEYGI